MNAARRDILNTSPAVYYTTISEPEMARPYMAGIISLLNQLDGVLCKMQEEVWDVTSTAYVYTESDVIPYLTDGVVIIAEVADEPVGVVVVGVDDEMGVKLVNISHLVVDAQFTGNRIGEELIHMATNYGKSLGGSRLYLDVYHINTAARKLYDRLGFTDVRKMVMKKI